MTHLYAYVKKGYSENQLKALVVNMKKAATEGFNIRDTGSTIAVKELQQGEYSDNLGALVLVYTAKGKGFDVKKSFAALLHKGITAALGAPGEVKMIIKEQANDMVGHNGLLRSQVLATNADYEEG